MSSQSEVSTVPQSRASATYVVHVLGCKVNQCEAREIERELERRGLRAARNDERPDVVVVHSCAVTSAALAESRRRLTQAVRSSTIVIASGCAAGLLPDSIDRDATLPAGPGWSEELSRTLDRLVGQPDAALPLHWRFTGHSRAFVKVQDGCDLGCAYCIVPRLRGPPRDRSLKEILAEVERYVRAGHGEIVLSGVSIGLWGRGSDAELADVVEAVAQLPGVQRVRLSSLHPAELSDRLLSAMRAHRTITPHMHLPLQSGSNAVLRRMRRRYTVKEFVEAVNRIRHVLDEPAITTDIMAGFPGESEHDFEETIHFCRTIGFSRLHVFAFSPRPGTPAAAMSGRLPTDVVRERAAELRKVGQELATRWYGRWVGREVDMLTERWSAVTGHAFGYCARYCPVTAVARTNPGISRLVKVQVMSATPHGLHGRVMAAGCGHSNVAHLRTAHG